jgi:hypothetical protein
MWGLLDRKSSYWPEKCSCPDVRWWRSIRTCVELSEGKLAEDVAILWNVFFVERSFFYIPRTS